MEQLIYTSCRTGINNSGSGFQVYSYSAGMSDSMVLNAQRYICRYKEPFSLPAKPTMQQVKELFPRAFKYLPLDGQHMSLCQSSYIGADYMGENGRFGNFISHMICFSGDDFNEYPISFCNCGMFCDDLEQECKNSYEVPQHLPQLAAEHMAQNVNEDMSFERVCEFICGDEDRTECLKMLVAALIEGYGTGKRLIICDRPESIAYWIAAVTMSFSKNAAKNIFFTTYEYNPDDSDAVICGVFPEGTDYDLKNAKSSGLYYVFDFIRDDLPDIDTEHEFLELVQAGFEFSKDSLYAFFDFLDEIGVKKADKRIYSSYELYLLFEGSGGENLSADGTSKFVKLISDIASDGGARKICAKLEQKSELVSQAFSIDDLSMILAGLLSCLTDGCADGDADEAYGLLFKMLLRISGSDLNGGARGALKLYEMTMDGCADRQSQALKFLFERGCDIYRSLPPLIRITLLAKLLQLNGTDMAEYAKSEKGRQITDDLYAQLNRMPDDKYEQLAEEVFSCGADCAEKLMEIFKSALSDEERLSAAVREFLTGFGAGCDCTEERIKRKYNSAFSFIKGEKKCPQVVFCFIEEIEKDICMSIAPWKQWEFLKPIYEYKKEFSIPSTVNKSELIRFAAELKKLYDAGKFADAEKLVKQTKSLPFDRVEVEEQGKYIDFVMPIVLRLLNDDGSNISLINLFSKADAAALCRSMAESAEKECGDGRHMIYIIAAFGVYSDGCDRVDMSELYDRIREIAQRFGKKKLEAADRLATDNLDIKASKRWLELTEQIKSEKKGICSMLFGKFKSGAHE